MQELRKRIWQRVAVARTNLFDRSKANKRTIWQSKLSWLCVFLRTMLTYPSLCRYDGYNKDLVDRFCSMGFDVERVVGAFKYVGIDRLDGEDYELDEEEMGDITARLLGEP